MDHLCDRDVEAAAQREELTVATFESYIEQVLDRIPHHLPLRGEVAQDLRSTFAERAAHGETADEAIRQLGDPATLAESYLAALPLTPAPFMARVAAKLLDGLCYGLVLLIPALILVRATAGGAAPPAWNVAIFLLVVLSVVGFWLLTALAETWYSRTIGKKLMGLYVVRESGARISFRQAIVRQLPVVLNIFLIDALFALFTDKHQRAFELLSHTRTVRDPLQSSNTVSVRD